MSRTSGSTARARAMQRRCCWPPESPAPCLSRRSLTSSHRPAPSSASRTRSSISRRGVLVNLSPEATLSKIDIVGNGFGFWKTMPTARRTETTSTCGAYRFSPSSRTSPSALAPDDLLMHPVDAANHGRLAAAGGSDDRGDVGGCEGEADVLDRVMGAVVGVQGPRTRPDAWPRPGSGPVPVPFPDSQWPLKPDSHPLRRPAQLRSVPRVAGGSSQVVPLTRLLRWISLAIRVTIRIIAMSVIAAPQARWTSSLLGCLRSWKI